MIEEWLVKFVLSCFGLMGIVAWALHIIEDIGKDYIEKSDEKGEEE